MFVSPNNANSIVCDPSRMNSIYTKPLVRFSCRAAFKKVATETDTTDYYKLLSLSGRSNASTEEIKRAYRALALQYHPDVCDRSLKDQSTRMFVDLTAAYKTLSDPVLRREYDSVLGLTSHGRNFDTGVNRNTVWQQQIVELKRRSALRVEQRDGSWGSRMRAQNHRNSH